MSDDALLLHPFDSTAEAAAIRERSTVALRALLELSLGADDPMPALAAIRTLRARCDHLCHQLSLRIVHESGGTSDEVERPIDGDLMDYVTAGTPLPEINRYGVTER